MDNKFQFEIKINQFPHSCYPQEAWNMPHNITHSSQHFLNAQGTGRNMLNSHQRPVYHDLPPHKRSRTQFQYTNTGNTFKNQVPDNSFGGFETKNISSMGLPPKVFTNPLRVPPLIPSVQSHGPVTNTSWPNSVPVVQFHGPATSTVMSSPMPVAMQGHGNAMNPIRPYPISVMQSHSTATTTCTSMYMNPVRPNPINSMSLPQQPFPGALLPQPSSFPPPSSQQVIPNQQPCTGLSGFTDSLSAQEQDCVGLEFDAAKLKVRHESVIRALYADLPRQCASCGLRFKNQEEHRRHMDWHVVRNRMNKNQKQKHTSSRKWFANLSLWVKGAEASATEAVPIFFATKTIEEEKVVEELFAVIADEDQKICALCHEAFEDFFSHEADDWMYKGAVYLNSAPEGSIPGIDSFQLGPIVHAKCRPESSVISSNDVRQNRGIIH